MWKLLAFCLTVCVLNSCTQQTDSWIRINQVGYLPNDIKVAVWVSKGEEIPFSFRILDEKGNTQFESEKIEHTGSYGPFNTTARLDFSDFTQSGTFYIESDNVSSEIRIGNDVYANAPDFLLKYMRQQRCGYNPYLKDSCHLQDGYTMYAPMADSTQLDVTGGWHDATDYLQYSTTSANAVINLLLAYRDYPASFEDLHQANGAEGSNQIPDVVDEAVWGLEWLDKMHPDPSLIFNQIADDRDHAGFRLPNHDSVDYGKGLSRPVYAAIDKPQGLFDYQNRSTGLASIAGKFSAAFSLASNMELPITDGEKDSMKRKSISSYLIGYKNPGYAQTAPGRAPYFYEEETWADDMELAGSSLWLLTKEDTFLNQARGYASLQPVVPWMGADTARHYQYYPFINLGHYLLAESGVDSIKSDAIEYYKSSIEAVISRADNTFKNGVPFIWCSNNLAAAFITQCLLYRKLSGDDSYKEYETSVRDWLLGVNPWGTTMIVGYPEWGDYPEDPHSSLNHLYGYQTLGGLVDGPVYGSIYNNLKGINLFYDDEYELFQSERVVYHDDVGDYSTNEPTMDGTATLMYYMAYLASGIE